MEERVAQATDVAPALGDTRLPKRFWSKVRLDEQTGCWIWTASLRRREGVGQFAIGGSNHWAHVLAYRKLMGRRSPGRPAWRCGRRECCNPSHLRFDLVTSDQVARAIGVSGRTVDEWAQKRLVPFVGVGPKLEQRQYDIGEVKRALADLGWIRGRLYGPDTRKRTTEARRRDEQAAGVRQCYVCRQSLPLDQFLTVHQKDKRSKHEYHGPSFDCRDCRREQRREWRRRKAEEAGRRFVPRGDREAWEAQIAIARAEREAARQEQIAARRADHEAAREATRQHIRTSAMLTCVRCALPKQRDQFHPSFLASEHASDVMCKACSSTSDAKRFANASETLSDSYVKRQIFKRTGLHGRDVPPVLIEATRATLMVKRLLWERIRYESSDSKERT